MSSEHSYPKPAVGWSGVGILFLLYTFSFVDRSILGLLVDPLKQALKIGDVQISLLIGASFAIFYGTLGIPIARLADIGNRWLLIVGGALLWALCTLLCGFASSFLVIVLLRVGLAIGEAVLSPSAYSLISDWFPKDRRGFPSSVYAWAGGIGTSLASMGVALILGFVVERHGLSGTPVLRSFQPWQLMFFIVGAPTVVIAILFGIFIREPKRIDASAAGDAVPRIAEVAAYLVRHRRLYAGLLLGCGLNTLGSAGIGVWAPQLLKRNYHWLVSDAGVALGGLLGLSSIVGYVLLPRLSEWMRDRASKPDLPILLSIGLSAIGCSLIAAAPLTPAAWMFLTCLGVGSPMMVGSAMLAITSIPVIAPPRMRGIVSSIYLLISSALTLTLAPLLVALLAKKAYAGHGEHALAWGAATVAAATPFLTVSLLAWARKPYAEAIRAHLKVATRRSSAPTAPQVAAVAGPAPADILPIRSNVP